MDAISETLRMAQEVVWVDSEVTVPKMRASSAARAAGVREVWWSLDLARGRVVDADEDMAGRKVYGAYYPGF